MNKLLSQPLKLIGKTSSHLLHSNIMRGSGIGSYQVCYSFGFAEIKRSVQKGLQGKLTWLRSSCSVFDKQRDDPLDDITGTMAANFYYAFFSILLRSKKDSDNDFIENGITITNKTKMQGMTCL